MADSDSEKEQFEWDPVKGELVDVTKKREEEAAARKKEEERLKEEEKLKRKKEKEAKKAANAAEGDGEGDASSDSDSEEESESEDPVSTPYLIGTVLAEGPESEIYKMTMNKWIRDDRMPKYFFYYYTDEKKLYCWDSSDWAMYRWRSSLDDMEFINHCEIDTSNKSFASRQRQNEKKAQDREREISLKSDLWITIIPPEVTQLVVVATRVYEVPKNLMKKIFGAPEKQIKALERMKKQASCSFARFLNLDDLIQDKEEGDDQNDEKKKDSQDIDRKNKTLKPQGIQIKVRGTMKQVATFGNCVEMGIMSANPQFMIDQWRKRQQAIHQERLKQNLNDEDRVGGPPGADADSSPRSPDQEKENFEENLAISNENDAAIAQNRLSKDLATLARKYKLPLTTTRYLMKLDAQLQRYIIRKFRLPAENSKPEKLIMKFVQQLSKFPQRWRLEALIMDGDMDDVCETRILNDANPEQILGRREETTAVGNTVVGGQLGVGGGQAEDDSGNLFELPYDAEQKSYYGNIQPKHCKVHNLFGYWHATALEGNVGILLDGQKILGTVDGPIPLRDGSIIQCGETLVLCEIGTAQSLTDRRNKCYEKLFKADNTSVDDAKVVEKLDEKQAEQGNHEGGESIQKSEITNGGDAANDEDETSKKETLLPPLKKQKTE